MSVPVARVVLLGMLCLLPGGAAWWLAGEAIAGWDAWSAPAHGVDAGVVAVAATVGAVLAGWLALGALVSAGCVLAGSARRPVIVPAAVHRAVTLVLGVALAAGAAPPPGAGHGPAPDPVAAIAAIATAPHRAPDPAWTPIGRAAAAPVRAGDITTPPTAPDPGWRPSAAPVAPPRTVAEPIDPILLTGSRQSPVVEPVTVRRGDTLWDLAARHLGAGATDIEIAAEWPRWYAANRGTVGADPDLLLPGQQLTPPGRVNGG